MEIVKKEKVGDIYYFTVKSVNKFISVDKIINLIDNADDYIDKDGFDKEVFKEDVLEPRD